MKTGIHPQWFPNAQVTCICGNIFTIGSTQPKIRVDICHKCHPFYTGQMKYVDTAGQVEKFQRKQAVGQTKAADLAKKKAKRKGQVIEEEKGPKTLKEMLLGE